MNGKLPLMTEATKELVAPIVLAIKSTVKTAYKHLIQLWQKNGIPQRMVT
jgi:hypothetical protein